MEKQSSLIVLSLTEESESGGAVLESERTASYRRRDAGRGRFSGTMVSSGLFPCHDGHILFWLHLATPPTKTTCSCSSYSSSIEFDMVTTMISSLGTTTTSCDDITELLNCSPIIVKHDATPITTHGLFQLPLFFSLYLHNIM